MSFPSLIPESVIVAGITVKIDAEPVLVWRVPFLFLDIFKSEKLTACVVENTVNYHFNAIFMAKLCKFAEIIVSSKPTVNQFVISGVISMTG